MFNRCSGNTFIRINACELPTFIFLDQLRIMLHLQLIAACLSIFIRTDAAIGANTQLLLFGFKVQLMCCRDDLNLSLGAVQINFAYGGFGSLLCLGTTTAWMDFQHFTPLAEPTSIFITVAMPICQGLLPLHPSRAITIHELYDIQYRYAVEITKDGMLKAAGRNGKLQRFSLTAVVIQSVD